MKKLVLLIDKFIAFIYNQNKKKIINEYHSFSTLWNIDFKCNGNCVYCEYANNSDSSTDKNKIKNSIDAIIQNKPRVLIITGGEPTLSEYLIKSVVSLKEIITDLKIVIITNLLKVDLEMWSRLNPHLFSIMISLDGVGDVNFKNRSVNGDLIINNIKQLVGIINDNIYIIINSVVNINNYNNIGELIRVLNDIYPYFIFILSAQTPKDDLLSINNDKEKVKKFLEYEKKLKYEYGKNKIYSNGFDSISMYCYAQKYQNYILPEGDMYNCFQKKFTGEFNDDHFINHVKKYYIQDWRNIIKYIISTISNKNNYLCFNPCNNLYFVNEIMKHDINYEKYIFGPFEDKKQVIISSLLAIHFNNIFMFDELFTKTSLKYLREGWCNKKLDEIYTKLPLTEMLNDGFKLENICIDFKNNKQRKINALMYFQVKGKQKEYPIVIEKENKQWKVNAVETFEKWIN